MSHIQRETSCSRPRLNSNLDADLYGYRWARDNVGQSGATIYRLYGKPDAPELFLKHGKATIKRVELGESVTLSTLIGILRGLDRLHQLESILFDSHMRTFKAQLNAGTPSRIRIRKKTHQPKEKLPAAAQTNEADATINEWYTSSASNSVVWSFTPSDGEKKS